MSKKRKKKSGRKRPAPARPQGAGPARQKPKPSDREREPDVQARASSKAGREAVRSRRQAAARRRRNRNIAVVVGVLVVALAFAGWRMWEGRQVVAEHMALAEEAGCAEVQSFGTQDRTHIEGQVIEYDTNPPVGGAHQAASLPARVYPEPFSRDPTQQPNLYQAVHSLEHGYVIVWHNDLTEAERDALEAEFRAEDKTIVVPWPELGEEHDGIRMALTAWRHKQLCADPDSEVVHSFIDLYREARTAPEPDAP